MNDFARGSGGAPGGRFDAGWAGSRPTGATQISPGVLPNFTPPTRPSNTLCTPAGVTRWSVAMTPGSGTSRNGRFGGCWADCNRKATWRIIRNQGGGARPEGSGRVREGSGKKRAARGEFEGRVKWRETRPAHKRGVQASPLLSGSHLLLL